MRITFTDYRATTKEQLAADALTAAANLADKKLTNEQTRYANEYYNNVILPAMTEEEIQERIDNAYEAAARAYSDEVEQEAYDLIDELNAELKRRDAAAVNVLEMLGIE
jgi:hypothetical protein